MNLTILGWISVAWKKNDGSKVPFSFGFHGTILNDWLCSFVPSFLMYDSCNVSWFSDTVRSCNEVLSTVLISSTPHAFCEYRICFRHVVFLSFAVHCFSTLRDPDHWTLFESHNIQLYSFLFDYWWKKDAMKIVFPTIFTCQNNKNMFYTYWRNIKISRICFYSLT